ncbi:MAG: hypothetical protein ACE367_00445 [Acidimicrobiales bacterium]
MLVATVRSGADHPANVEADLADDAHAVDREVTVKRFAAAGATVSDGDERRASAVHRDGSGTVVEGFVDGFRVFEVIASADAAHTFDYGIDIDGRPAQFLPVEDGSVLVGRGNEADFVAIGRIDAPWAIDGQGRDVGSNYAVSDDGTRLQLSAERSGAARYPLTADPSFTFFAGEVHCSWGSCTFYLERSRSRWIHRTLTSHSGDVAVGTVASAACGWLGAALGLGWVAMLSCAAIVASQLWQLTHHTRGKRCLTFKRWHWETAPYSQISSVPIHHSRCHRFGNPGSGSW